MQETLPAKTDLPAPRTGQIQKATDASYAIHPSSPAPALKSQDEPALMPQTGYHPYRRHRANRGKAAARVQAECKARAPIKSNAMPSRFPCLDMPRRKGFGKADPRGNPGSLKFPPDGRTKS